MLQFIIATQSAIDSAEELICSAMGQSDDKDDQRRLKERWKCKWQKDVHFSSLHLIEQMEEGRRDRLQIYCISQRGKEKEVIRVWHIMK